MHTDEEITEALRELGEHITIGQFEAVVMLVERGGDLKYAKYGVSGGYAEQTGAYLEEGEFASSFPAYARVDALAAALDGDVEGHECPVGPCTNWVAYDDETVCFEHTPPVSPRGCRCSGCRLEVSEAALKRELDILFGVIRTGPMP
jgi:hypothetical protein